MKNEFPVLNEAVIMENNRRLSLYSLWNLYDGERFIDDYMSVIENCLPEQANQSCTFNSLFYKIYFFQ